MVCETDVASEVVDSYGAILPSHGGHTDLGWAIGWTFGDLDTTSDSIVDSTMVCDSCRLHSWLGDTLSCSSLSVVGSVENHGAKTGAEAYVLYMLGDVLI